MYMSKKKLNFEKKFTFVYSKIRKVYLWDTQIAW